MKVTQENIERLYRFTREHFVEHYDVQSELVDHLANGIEQQWAIDPTIPFEEALNREFKKFGVFGFSELVEKRINSLEKKYFKIVIQLFLKQWIKFPEAPVLLGVVGLVYVVLTQFNYGYEIMLLFYLAIIVCSIVKMVQASNKHKKQFLETGKKFMIDEYFKKYNVAVFLLLPIFQIVFNIRISPGTDIVSEFYALILSVIFATFLGLFKVMFFEIPSKKESLVPNLYANKL